MVDENNDFCKLLKLNYDFIIIEWEHSHISLHV